MTFREESGQTKSVTLVRALPSSFDHFPRYSSVASVPVVPAASCSRSGAPLDGSTPLASDSAVWCPAQRKVCLYARRAMGNPHVRNFALRPGVVRCKTHGALRRARPPRVMELL